MASPTTPGRTAVDALCGLLDDAFDVDAVQSLLANLRGLDDADWTALPPGAGRSIAEHVEHVAWAKWMYIDMRALLKGTDRWPY